MKRWLPILLALVLVLGLAACGDSKTPETGNSGGGGAGGENASAPTADNYVEIINDVNSDGYFFDDTFAGIPDGVTVHIPDSLSDGDKATVEAKLHSFGLPDSAVFDYYSWRG